MYSNKANHNHVKFLYFICITVLAHCAKVQKYNRAKQVSNSFLCGTKNVVEHWNCESKSFWGLTLQGKAIPSFLAEISWIGYALDRSDLKRTPMQDFISFSIVLYYIISITYQKIGDLLCLVDISVHSHSVLGRTKLGYL